MASRPVSERPGERGRPEGLDQLAPHVEIVWPADGLELAGDDEIGHLASIDAQKASVLEPAYERRDGSHTANEVIGDDVLALARSLSAPEWAAPSDCEGERGSADLYV